MVRAHAGTLALLVATTAMAAGCLGTSNDAVTVRVDVETSYDPELAPSPEARERGEELGFRRGDPASIGQGDLLVHVTNHPSGGDTVVDPWQEVPENETLDLGRYRLPLGPGGGTSFEVQAPGPLYVAAAVDGEPSPQDEEEDCAGTYIGGLAHLPEDEPPERRNGYAGPLEGDLNVTVPFALRC